MRKLLVFLIILAVVGVGADRIAHKYATDEAEKRLATAGLTQPKVDVGGFPFLTQLLSRRFDEVQVTTTEVRTSTGQAEQVKATARDVQVHGTTQAVIGSLTARGTISYDEVLRQAGQSGLRLRDAGGGKVELRRDVTVLGRTLSVSGRARVEPHGTRLRVVPTSFQLSGGGPVDDQLSRLLADRFAFSYRVRGLPSGVEIRRITPGPDGFVVDVAGRNVTVSEAASTSHALSLGVSRFSGG
ncbi:MAG: LmeA family phospholipid-binding protein [Actinomycetes bacterium]